MERMDSEYIRLYDRECLRAAFGSLLWAIVTERRKTDKANFRTLAEVVGIEKAQMLQWLDDETYWTIDTIVLIASALDFEIRIQAVDRRTGAVFTPAGRIESGGSND